MNNGGILIANVGAVRSGNVLIANLAKGQIGEQAANLLGSLILSHLQLVTMARSELARENRAPFFVHVDEYSSFSSEVFGSLMSEARKFGTHFALAGQYLEQVTSSIRAAVLGNAGTLMVFRVSATDAHLLAPEFFPLPAPELADQAPFTAWLKRGDLGHRAIHISPSQFPSRGRRNFVVAQSRRNFARAKQTFQP
jgi:hypothetical protein